MSESASRLHSAAEGWILDGPTVQGFLCQKGIIVRGRFVKKRRSVRRKESIQARPNKLCIEEWCCQQGPKLQLALECSQAAPEITSAQILISMHTLCPHIMVALLNLASRELDQPFETAA
jgi:hypothetical protein